MKRVEKGEVYYFISLQKLKLCSTHDWYFFSDNEKWEDGNYFTDAALAKACADEVQEYALPLQEKTEGKYSKAVHTFLAASRVIAQDLKLAGKDAAEEMQLFSKAWDGYAAVKKEVDAERVELAKGVEMIIRKYRTFADVTPEDMAKQ